MKQDPHYFHYYGKKHIKKKKAPVPALVVDIKEVVQGALLTYRIKIIRQKYKCFNFYKGGHRFEASNGFRLISDGCPEVAENNRPTKRGDHMYANELFVRGSLSYRDNDMTTAYGQAYIAELKIAVEEYNDHMKRG